MTDVVVPFTGWGRGAWGSQAWGRGSVSNAGASGEVGSVTVSIGADVFPTGVEGTGNVGSVSVLGDSTVSVSGVFATGQVGAVLVWGRLVPDQAPGYVPIVPSQVATWTQISP